MKNLYFRRALLATALIASPALAGLPPVEYVGPGWYVWVSGVYEDGTEYRNPADGAFSEKSACLTKRDEWIAGDIKANPDKPSKNKYSCTYHDKDWYDDPNYDDVL